MACPDDKQQRMEVRRSIGNRTVPGPYVAPYHRGPDYLIAHACLDCRKAWKRSGDRDHSCPECGEALALMGRTFRTPAKREDDQWEKVRRLWKAGFRFWSYRSFPDAEPFPAQLREVDAFIARNIEHPMRIKT
jgi:ssDNA-binding Zn-finger/Zn-ribbon topoisomerase 1